MSQTALPPNQAMALSQLYTNAINDPALLDALASTLRCEFVPKHLEDCAYVDEDLHMGEGRYMLAPLDQARLIQAADIQPTDRVLDVACATGYSTAIIAKLAGQVIGIDRSAMFKQRAEEQFSANGITNTHFHVVDNIAQGYEAGAPYDAIIINGSIQAAPQALANQLSDGGRLVYAQHLASSGPGIQGISNIIVITRQETQLTTQQIGECAIPQLAAFNITEGFRF